MSDTPKKDSRTESKKPTNAVVFKSGIPKWELTADEIAYPFIVEQKGTEFLTFVVLRQHTDVQDPKGFAYAYKHALQAATTDTRLDANVMEPGFFNEIPFRKFVDTHFAGLLATSAKSVEEQRVYLDAHPFEKTRIFTECVQGIAVDETVVLADPEALLDLTLADMSHEITLVQNLYSPETDDVRTIQLTHNCEEETEKDYQTWRKAKKSRYNIRKKELSTLENYDVMDALYNRMVRSVEGALFKGQPCEGGTKDKWLPYLPLEQKLLVLTKIFERTQRKNA
jgi:hypothetical protein